MLRFPRLGKPARGFLAGSFFLGACLTAAPVANAQTVPQIDPAQLAQQLALQLDSSGIQLPQPAPELNAASQHLAAEVDRTVGQIQKTVDSQVGQVLAQVDGRLSPQHSPNRSQNYSTELPSTELSTERQPATNPYPLGLEKLDSLEKLTQTEFTPIVVDPNYVWKNDGFSKFMAMKPGADFVLHRVPGSYFDAPHIPEESNVALAKKHSLYGPGTPLYVGQDMMCTLTVAGKDATGRKVGLTAAHCGEVGEQVVSADSWQAGPTGTIVSKNPALDYAVVEFNDKAEITNEYNGVRAWGLGGGVKPGEVTCKRGVATGTTCGLVFLQEKVGQINHVCAMPGDSGAPLFKGGRVVGAVSGGLGTIPCRTPWQGIVHSPTHANNIDAVLADLNRRGGVGKGFSL